MTWKVPMIVHHSDFMANDEDDMSWEQFHKLVRKNCGAYLRECGERDLREIIDNSVNLAKIKRKNPNQKVDDYFDYMEDNVYNKR